MLRLKALHDLALDPATSDSLADDAIHDLVGGRANIVGPWQLGWLEAHGLHADSRLLDLGCGTLRGGMPIMARLRPGHYTGVEPLAELLDLGRLLLARHGFTSRSPRLYTLADWDAVARSHEFDFVLTHSVLNHLDGQGIERTIERVASVLAAQGRWLTTVALSEAVSDADGGQPHPWRAGEWWKTLIRPGWFVDRCRARGLTIVAMPDIDHPAGLTTAVLRIE